MRDTVALDPFEDVVVDEVCPFNRGAESRIGRWRNPLRPFRYVRRRVSRLDEGRVGPAKLLGRERLLLHLRSIGLLLGRAQGRHKRDQQRPHRYEHLGITFPPAGIMAQR